MANAAKPTRDHSCQAPSTASGPLRPTNTSMSVPASACEPPTIRRHRSDSSSRSRAESEATGFCARWSNGPCRLRGVYCGTPQWWQYVFSAAGNRPGTGRRNSDRARRATSGRRRARGRRCRGDRRTPTRSDREHRSIGAAAAAMCRIRRRPVNSVQRLCGWSQRKYPRRRAVASDTIQHGRPTATPSRPSTNFLDAAARRSTQPPRHRSSMAGSPARRTSARWRTTSSTR